MSTVKQRKRTEDVFVDDDNATFESMDLKPDILKGLTDMGFDRYIFA